MTDVTEILEALNPAQRSAVTAPLQHCLILAGAGSGKTRVLVHRIIWLMRVEQVPPHAILAVTFTNKAARELRERIESMLGHRAEGMWTGTFHGLSHRVLRAHAEAAGLPPLFQILDSDDQLRTIKRVTKALNLEEAYWPARKTQGFINAKKDEGMRSRHCRAQGDPYTKTLISLYAAYEEACESAGVIDFAEILLRCHELWLAHPEILSHYQQRFSHLLVDEFQDTNAVQYAWLRLLGKHATLMAVGDDDQSIYGWRGAKIENIQRFDRDFPDTLMIRLEQNYRSTGMILNAANALIANNESRLGKSLWTEGEAGEPVSVYAAFNELDEARFVVAEIQKAITRGLAKSELAILYRSNAQSRVIEEALIEKGIPYRVYGGLRFFDRAEIKDVLAYLRITANRDDDAAFERIVNHPPRGIGEKTVSTLRETAQAEHCSLWKAAEVVLRDKVLTSRAEKALSGFIEGMNILAAGCEGLALDEHVAQVAAQSQLVPYYQRHEGERAISKAENIAELVNACKTYRPDPDDESELLISFLSQASLDSAEHQADAFEDSIQLMTLHMAKGLEFHTVFLVGVEEGLFPHKMALEEGDRLAEERRLCYVGMTRARQQLVISHAACRRQYGAEEYHRPSRFLREIPAEFKQEVRTTSAPKRFEPDSHSQELDGFYMGQGVVHDTFGRGVVINCEGQGSRAQVQVQFEQHGKKWLMVRYANLGLLEEG